MAVPRRSEKGILGGGGGSSGFYIFLTPHAGTVAGADLILVPGSCVASGWMGGPSED